MKKIDSTILTEIVKEIVFGSGHASDKNLEDMATNALYTHNIDDELDSTGDMSTWEIMSTSPKNVKFRALIKKYFVEVGSNGDYKLLLSKKKSYGQKYYYLVNTKAFSIGEFFAGTIKTEINKGSKYNLKKGFEIQIETVHWSNIASELMGTGAGKIMYTLVYEYVTSQGLAFGSDSMLYEGSAGMWIKYMSSIAQYFGVIIEDVMIPVPPEEMTIKNKPIFEKVYEVEGFVAMENPPTSVRKIAYNVKGLSFIGGEYGIVDIRDKINDPIYIFNNRDNDEDEDKLTVSYDEKTGTYNTKRKANKKPKRFMDYVQESSTLKELLNSPVKQMFSYVIGAKKTKYKTVIFAFQDAIVVVKQTANGLVSVAI